METNEHVVITESIAYRIFGPKFMSKVYYKLDMKRTLNLENPGTFTEKINWYKLFYCPYNELIIKCSDKYTVRPFLEKQGFGKYLSELIGVWDDPDDICWDELPDKFVLKNSNGCGYNIICDKKSCLDEKETKQLLKKWLNEHFGYYNAEPHYEIGKKRIICEKYIESGHLLPIDYKVHCMNGIPKVLQVCDERTNKVTKYYYYNMQGEPLQFGKYLIEQDISLDGALLAEMNSIAEKIAGFFPYVRVDFFINNGHLQISELTFSPSAGLKPDLNYNNGDEVMGKMLDFDELVRNSKH